MPRKSERLCSAAPTATDFDSAAVAASLFGTWRHPASEEPTGVGYLHFSDDGRAFQFVYDPHHPDRRIPMRLWYSVESSSTLRLRPKDNADGWTCNYRLDGTTLTLLPPTRSFSCSRVTPEELPGWFREALAAKLQHT